MLGHRFTGPAALALAGASLAMAPPVAAADSTATSVTFDPVTPVTGQSVQVTATVSDSDMPGSTPTGTVQFAEGAVMLSGPIDLATGKASTTTSFPTATSHTITATYASNAMQFASGSASASVAVNPGDTATTLSVSPNPAVAGQGTTLAATVTAKSPATGTPTGLVVFSNRNGPDIDTVGLDLLGHASTLAFGLAGLYTVDARYQGDANFNPSTGPADIRVNRAATTTTLTVSPNPAVPGGTIAYAANVAVVAPGDVEPGGTLQFAIDGVPVGPGIPLGGGVNGFSGSLTAPPGDRTYSVSVTYSGDDDTEPSSASAAERVAAPTTTSTSSTSVSTAPTIRVSRLNAMVSILVAALRARGFSAFTSTVQSLTAPGPGVLEQKVYSPSAPKAAIAAAAKRVLVASGRHRFATAGRGKLRLKLSSAGRRLIRHARKLRLAIVTRFTPTGGTPVVTIQRLTVRAKRGR